MTNDGGTQELTKRDIELIRSCLVDGSYTPLEIKEFGMLCDMALKSLQRDKEHSAVGVASGVEPMNPQPGGTKELTLVEKLNEHADYLEDQGYVRTVNLLREAADALRRASKESAAGQTGLATEPSQEDSGAERQASAPFAPPDAVLQAAKDWRDSGEDDLRDLCDFVIALKSAPPPAESGACPDCGLVDGQHAWKCRLAPPAESAPSPLGALADVIAYYDEIVNRLDSMDAEADFVMRGSDWRPIRAALCIPVKLPPYPVVETIHDLAPVNHHPGFEHRGLKRYVSQADYDEIRGLLQSAPAEAGYVPVPVEPTERMLEAGRKHVCFHDTAQAKDDARLVYKAMLSAAGKKDEKEGG